MHPGEEASLTQDLLFLNGHVLEAVAASGAVNEEADEPDEYGCRGEIWERGFQNASMKTLRRTGGPLSRSQNPNVCALLASGASRDRTGDLLLAKQPRLSDCDAL